MKRAILTLLLLTLAASGTATPSEVPQPPSTVGTLRGAPQSTLTGGRATDAVGRAPLSEAAQPSAGAPASIPTFPGAVGTVLIGGWATWYDDPRKDGRYAAAGPLLRQTLGDWRGKVIRVTSGNRATLVQLSDWCACGFRNTVPTLIDLSPEAFADLAPLTQGLVRVEIEVLALPATDTPDEHPQDPPEHPDDARMRLEDR